LLAALEGAIVAALIALPGAGYTWGFEQAVSGWGAGLADRTLRFVGGSAVFAVITAPLSFWIYHGQVTSGRLAHGQLWWPAWPVLIGYVIVPFAVGRITGRAVQRGRWWPGLLVGPAPAPRAWDHVFLAGRSAYIRVRLKDAGAGTDGWVLGIFSPHRVLGAYASGPPNEPDLYLSDTAEAIPGTGEFRLNDDGLPYLRGVGLLIRYEEILYIEVTWHEEPGAVVEPRRGFWPGWSTRAIHRAAPAEPAAGLLRPRGRSEPAYGPAHDGRAG
jgi:hypothetical protein